MDESVLREVEQARLLDALRDASHQFQRHTIEMNERCGSTMKGKYDALRKQDRRDCLIMYAVACDLGVDPHWCEPYLDRLTYRSKIRGQVRDLRAAGEVPDSFGALMSLMPQRFQLFDTPHFDRLRERLKACNMY